jgi:transcriptional regulator with XRE-family HTH domain
MGASHFGLMLRQLRHEKGATLSDVADATGISVPMLSRMERGERLPSSETLKTLSSYYGTSARQLAEAAGHQHSLNRYKDSMSDEPPDFGPARVPDDSLAQAGSLAASNAAPRLQLSSLTDFDAEPRAMFRARPISALFDAEAEEPADAVQDATVAAEAAVRQLGRELKRSASSMSGAERARVRDEVRKLGDALEALDDAPWWHGA